MADQPRIDKGTSTGGQFTTRARAEGGVSLTAPDRPLTSTEFGIAADKGFELRDLEPNDVVSLPDGSSVEVEHADFVRDGDDIWEIVENGHYVRTHPDGHTDVLTFNDLSERASVADDLAFDAVRRTQAAASVDAPDSFWHGTEPNARVEDSEMGVLIEQNRRDREASERWQRYPESVPSRPARPMSADAIDQNMNRPPSGASLFNPHG